MIAEEKLDTPTWELGLFDDNGIEAIYLGYTRIPFTEEMVEELFSPNQRAEPIVVEFAEFQGPGEFFVRTVRLMTKGAPYVEFEMSPRLRLVERITVIARMYPVSFGQ